jgi:flagellar biosynthesis/type III secretory pathway protein FliH
MAISPQKYFFDNNDFDEEALRRKREALRKPTFSQEEMEASRQTGFAQGRAEGQRETMTSLEAQLRELMQQITAQAALFLDNENARLATFIDQATQITAQILVKVMPVLLKTLGLVEIERFVRDTLRTHVKKGRLIVLVPPQYEQAVKDRFAALPAAASDDWEIRPDPDLTSYQARVEWSGGGAEWNPEHVASVALQAIFDHLPDELKAQTVDAPPQTEHTSDGDAS